MGAATAKPKMKLRAIPREGKPVMLALRIPKALHDDLQLYRKLYEEDVQGDSIKLQELVLEILRQFLGEDRGFVAYKKRFGER